MEPEPDQRDSVEELGRAVLRSILSIKDTLAAMGNTKLNSSSSSSIEESEESKKTTSNSSEISEEEIERPASSRSSDPSCSICLEPLQNKSFTDSCRHAFCFACLCEWSKVKAECPVCKQQFKTIFHNLREDHTFDEYVVDSKPKGLFELLPRSVADNWFTAEESALLNLVSLEAGRRFRSGGLEDDSITEEQ